VKHTARLFLGLILAVALVACGQALLSQRERAEHQTKIVVENQSWFDSRVRVYHESVTIASFFVAALGEARRTIDARVGTVYFGIDPVGGNEWLYREVVPVYPQTTTVLVIGIQPEMTYWSRR